MSGGGGGVVKTLAGHNERRCKPHANTQQLPGIISSPPPPSSSSPMHHTEEALREIHRTASPFGDASNSSNPCVRENT